MRFALACVEKGICLFLWQSVSACTQGYCSVKERRMGIYGERRYLMGFIGTLDTHQKVSEQYIHTTVQQRFLGLVIEMVKSSPS